VNVVLIREGSPLTHDMEVFSFIQAKRDETADKSFEQKIRSQI
jgi:hypothetical protein